MANEQILEEVNKTITESFEKSLPTIVETAVDKRVADIESKTIKEIDNIKQEMKKLNHSFSAWAGKADDMFKKTFIVSVFKDVITNNINNEKGFNQVVERNMKDMSEGTSTEGAELVFDQFEQDILKIINDFQVVSDVRILNLNKGDKVSLPKATNGITTYFVDEGTAITESDAATAFVVINISKAATLTDFTEELLDDTMTVPDLYNLLVEFIGESQAEFLETQILTGTANVDGILPSTDVNEVTLAATETAADIDDDALVEVITTAGKKFKRNRQQVKWYMSQYVFGKILALKTTDWYPLYPELRGPEPMLMGYKVVLSDVGFVQDATGDTADEPLILFGDLKYYILCRRKGLSMERGYHGDNWAKDIQSLKSNSRYGWEMSFPEALTVLKNGAVS